MLRTRLMAVIVSAAALLGAASPASAESARDTTTSSLRTTISMGTLASDGAGIDVAVLDTGVVSVPGVPASQVLYGPDMTADAFNPVYKNLDTFGHGTAMASMILSVAPKSRIVSVKVGSASAPATAAGIIGGIDWVVKNARTEGRNIRVMNVSFGLTVDPSNGLISAALTRAWNAGIVVVAAAGNGGNSAKTLDSPARETTFVAVGAASADGRTIAPFSSGATGWFARQPDVVAPGAGLVGARVPGSYLDEMYPNARVGTDGFRGSGTSQATAVTSGVAALVLQKRPTLTSAQVKSLLMSTAKPIAGVSATVQGKGLINAYAAVTPANTAIPWFGISWTWSTSTWPSLTQILSPLTGTMWSGDVGQDSGWSGNRWSGTAWSANRWSGSSWE